MLLDNEITKCATRCRIERNKKNAEGRRMHTECSSSTYSSIQAFYCAYVRANMNTKECAGEHTILRADERRESWKLDNECD